MRYGVSYWALDNFVLCGKVGVRAVVCVNRCIGMRHIACNGATGSWLSDTPT